MLSCLGNEQEAEPWRNIAQSDVKVVCDLEHVQESEASFVRLADELGVPADGVPELYAFVTHLDLGRLEQFDRRDLREAQLEDGVLQVVRRALDTGQWPANTDLSDPDADFLKRERQKLKVENGLMYRVTHRSIGELHQLLLPKKFKMQVIRALHDDMGHLGVERTTELVRNRIYWPKMTQTKEK